MNSVRYDVFVQNFNTTIDLMYFSLRAQFGSGENIIKMMELYFDEYYKDVNPEDLDTMCKFGMVDPYNHYVDISEEIRARQIEEVYKKLPKSVAEENEAE